MNREQTRNRADRLRAINAPHRVEVELDADGTPVEVREAGGGMRMIEDIGEVWHVDDEWWRVPITRRYVEAILESGKRVVLFEDINTGEWWTQKPA